MSGLAARLILAQIVCAAALAIPAVTLIGACAAWVPVAGTAFGGFLVWILLGRADPARLTRVVIRRISLLSAVTHGPLIGVAYAVFYVVASDQFDIPPSALWFLCPALGLGGAAVALAMTLVAGDAAAATLGLTLEPPARRSQR
ncbi:MAG: hypothetical protein AB8H79_18730 [Myxococcota bacterium]